VVNYAGLVFVAQSLGRPEVEGKRVIELGSKDEYGVTRRLLTPYGPSEYIGVDIQRGKGVDVVCAAEESVGKFGRRVFDVAVATELIEHTRDWRRVVSNIKNLLRPGGILVVTSRSIGFPFHAFPKDYWRYEEEDMRLIFSDCRDVRVERDWERPGVFVRAVIPEVFVENDLAEIKIFSVAAGKRIAKLGQEDERLVYRLRVARSRLRDAYYKSGHWMMRHL
jgi:SAM-dependent methyltransferase